MLEPSFALPLANSSEEVTTSQRQEVLVMDHLISKLPYEENGNHHHCDGLGVALHSGQKPYMIARVTV